jgi:antitoxin ParD1/3/4
MDPMENQQETMTSLNVSLPEGLKTFVEERASARYASASEYIRELIRRDQKDAAKERLEGLLLEGLESGEPMVVTEDYWNKKRQELAACQRKRKPK